MISGDAKELPLAAIHPSRQLFFIKTQIASRSSEKEHFLTCRCDARSQKREDLTKPRAGSKYIAIGLKEFPFIQSDAIHLARDDRTGSGADLAIFSSTLQERIQDSLTCPTGCEKPRFRLIHTPGHAIKIHLRPAMRAL